MLADSANPNKLPNSDVLTPCWNGIDLARRPRNSWIIDFGLTLPVETASQYAVPSKHILEHVKPERVKNNRAVRRLNWWRHGDGQPAMRAAIRGLKRYIATPEVTKHRIFAWLDGVILPDKKLMVIAKDDDYSFGVLQSHIHELWALAQCTWHGIGNDPRYTPTTCFETFPFPFPGDLRPPAPPPVEPPPKPSEPEPDRTQAESGGEVLLHGQRGAAALRRFSQNAG